MFVIVIAFHCASVLINSNCSKSSIIIALANDVSTDHHQSISVAVISYVEYVESYGLTIVITLLSVAELELEDDIEAKSEADP